jgi:hypothetical protein
VLAGLARLTLGLAILFGLALLLMNAIVDSLVYTIAAALMLFWSSCSTPSQPGTGAARQHHHPAHATKHRGQEHRRAQT